MTTTKTRKPTPRRDKWHEIEGQYFGQCIWQQILPNRRIMLEGLIHKGTGQIWIVEKSFNSPIPDENDYRRSYPELGGIRVYQPVGPEITDWDEFAKELA